MIRDTCGVIRAGRQQRFTPHESRLTQHELRITLLPRLNRFILLSSFTAPGVTVSTTHAPTNAFNQAAATFAWARMLAFLRRFAMLQQT